MYEPIHTKSVHKATGARSAAGSGPGPDSDYPHRSREEELDIQLAGHLAALLALTDELRALTTDADRAADLTAAVDDLARQIARLRGGEHPARAAVATAVHEPHIADLHRRAHALAGRALVVAASRADTAAAILAAERMDAHETALAPSGPRGSRELTGAH
ncbi:SCO4983 family protein [Streptomyces sp. O3]